jgi:hypothetical protein
MQEGLRPINEQIAYQAVLDDLTQTQAGGVDVENAFDQLRDLAPFRPNDATELLG